MSEGEVLVKVEGLSKKFCKSLKKSLKYGVQDLFSNVLGKPPSKELRADEFWALQDINFELRRGECLGLIGHNGAGKSTLLKILNGLINPDAGTVTIKGRVGALIELGAGFNPVMTGRENIYNNGAVLGFSRQEIDAKLEDIIDFAELREFIDMPVRSYSSGMKVRLGFAVAAQMEPDVLIIDEVLAVGDLSFRIKCYNSIASLLANTAIIFVSHSMPQVSKLCTSALMLEKGKLYINSRNTSEVINSYFLQSPVQRKVINRNELETKIVEKKIYVNDRLQDEGSIIAKKGDLVSIDLKLHLNKLINRFIVRLIIFDAEFKGIVEMNSLNQSVIFNNSSIESSIAFQFENNLNKGDYNATLIVLELLDDRRIGRRLLVSEGFLVYKSLVVENKFENYIPITIDANWKNL